LAMDIETNAEATMGKNLILNIIAFFFNLGLQFFVRGANKENPKKKSNAGGNGTGSNSTGTGAGSSSSSTGGANGAGGTTGGAGGGNGSSTVVDVIDIDDDPDEEILNTTVVDTPIPNEKGSKVYPTGDDDEGAVVIDDEVVSKIKKRQQQEKFGGGSLEINSELKHQKTPDGDILILYRGKSKEEWWNWSQFKYAVNNRINKFKTVASDEARQNQLEWIRLFESRMDFIENMRESKKPLPTRIPFDPNNPSKKIFGV